MLGQLAGVVQAASASAGRLSEAATRNRRSARWPASCIDSGVFVGTVTVPVEQCGGDAAMAALVSEVLEHAGLVD